MINQIIRSMFAGYKEASPRTRKQDWEYRNLTSDENPFLHGSDYLWEKYHQAKDEKDLFQIIRHMEKHETGGIESYDRVLGSCFDKLRKFENQREKGLM